MTSTGVRPRLDSASLATSRCYRTAFEALIYLSMHAPSAAANGGGRKGAVHTGGARARNRLSPHTCGLPLCMAPPLFSPPLCRRYAFDITSACKAQLGRMGVDFGGRTPVDVIVTCPFEKVGKGRPSASTNLRPFNDRQQEQESRYLPLTG